MSQCAGQKLLSHLNLWQDGKSVSHWVWPSDNWESMFSPQSQREQGKSGAWQGGKSW